MSSKVVSSPPNVPRLRMERMENGAPLPSQATTTVAAGAAPSRPATTIPSGANHFAPVAAAAAQMTTPTRPHPGERRHHIDPNASRTVAANGSFFGSPSPADDDGVGSSLKRSFHKAGMRYDPGHLVYRGGTVIALQATPDRGTLPSGVTTLQVTAADHGSVAGLRRNPEARGTKDTPMPAKPRVPPKPIMAPWAVDYPTSRAKQLAAAAERFATKPHRRRNVVEAQYKQVEGSMCVMPPDVAPVPQLAKVHEQAVLHSLPPSANVSLAAMPAAPISEMLHQGRRHIVAATPVPDQRHPVGEFPKEGKKHTTEEGTAYRFGTLNRNFRFSPRAGFYGKKTPRMRARPDAVTTAPKGSYLASVNASVKSRNVLTWGAGFSSRKTPKMGIHVTRVPSARRPQQQQQQLNSISNASGPARGGAAAPAPGSGSATKAAGRPSPPRTTGTSSAPFDTSYSKSPFAPPSVRAPKGIMRRDYQRSALTF